MKPNKLFLILPICSIALLTSGCATKCHIKHHFAPEQHHANKTQYKHKQHKTQPTQQISETVVFYQNYDSSDINKVNAKMYTRSSRGGESEMGIIKFKETDSGLKMSIDLIDLRPGKIYTAKIYQCDTCNDSICCDIAPMSIDLPKIKTNSKGRLQQSYIIRGLTATQLNNAKLILTRDGGYQAAWGTLLN